MASRICAVMAALVLIIVGLTVPSARAQQDPLESLGVRPVSTSLPVQNGDVDLTNGDVHLEIPLGTFAQRNSPPAQYSLVYDSAIWTQGSGLGWSSLGGYPWGYGWRLVSSIDPGTISFTSTALAPCPTDHTNGQYEYKNFSYSASDGTVHSFPSALVIVGHTNKCGSHSSNSGGGQATDASGYSLSVPVSLASTVFSPTGEIVYSSDSTLIPSVSGSYPGGGDSNGNYFDIDPTTAEFKDTLGRIPVAISAPNGNVITITVLNSKGGMSTYTVTTETINVWTDFDSAGSGLQEYKGSFTEIQSIALPDGTSYSFGYDSGTTQGHYGQLTSMTVPTGGQIDYSYANFDDSMWNVYGKHVTRGISTMTTPDGLWNFSYQVIQPCPSNQAQNCQQSTTVTTPPTPTEPSGDNSVYTFVINAGVWPTEIQYYNGAVATANLLASVAQTFDFSQQSNYPNLQAKNVTKTSSTLTLPLPSGANINRTTKYTWDTTTNYGNLLTQSEWNFYTGSLPATADRTTTYTYLNSTSYIQNSILNRPSSIIVTDKSGNTVSNRLNWYDQQPPGQIIGIAQHNDNTYGTGNTVRGNLTEVQRLISGTSNYLNTFKTYDMTGQSLTSTDSNNNVTRYSYADNFFTDIGDNSTPSTFPPPAPTNAFAKTVTQGSLVSTFGYYWGKGQKALSTDPNLQTTYSHFYDALDRPTSVKHPDGGWTYSVYPNGSETEIDTGTGITSTTLTTTCPPSSNACRHDEVLKDGLGRNSSNVLVSDPISAVQVVTDYDSNGRIEKTSNPYRTTTDSTYGWTMPGYDGLNRTIQVQEADGSVTKTYYGANVTTPGGLSSQLCSSSYGLGYPVLAVDEAGNKRQSWTDGFGRIIEADEPNSGGTLSVGTCYSYDLNNNLTGVAQGGVTRSFSYDLLSRLTMASNPETGPINYYYTTSGGSLCSGDPSAGCRRTDAKGVTTAYAYDTLNRLTSKTYSDSTHSATYSYDGATCIGASPCYNKGRRTGMVDAGGSEGWSYDRLGRESGDSRTTNSITKQTTYTYNLDGSLATLTYPTGRMVSYTPNAAGQPISSIDVANGVSYATNGSYAPNGALMTLSNSAQFNSTYIYNQRLQPCWMYTTVAPASLAATTGCGGSATTGTIMDMKPSFNKPAFNAGSIDNGNVIGITNNRDSTRSQEFGYDNLNRIYTAQTGSTFSTSPAHCWGEQFHYDQWANFLSISVSSSLYNGCTQQTLSLLVNTHNQITSPSGYVYDADGNLTATPAPGAATFTYNAENQMTSTAGVNYTYDGDGKRVEKSPGKLYWYGSSGEVLDETDLSGNLTSEYIYFKGQRIARRDSPSNSIFFYFGDHLGTSREIVQSGQTTACYEADFYPFGGERIITNSCLQNYKFTGKERDTESGNDYFKYRYYASTMGRWMSADPSLLVHADPRNPQSLNLYTYVGNNPLSRVDLDGLCIKGFQWACNVGQSLNNLVQGFGFHTDDTVDAMVQNANHTLLRNGINPDELSYKQRIKAAKKFESDPPNEPDRVIMISADAMGVVGELTHRAAPGYVGAGISLANDPSVPNAVVVGMGFVPVVGEAVTATGAVADAGLVAGEFVTDEGLAPMFNAAPPQQVDNGNQLVNNPALMDETDVFDAH